MHGHNGLGLGDGRDFAAWPPRNINAEMALLGSILLDNDVLHDVAAIVAAGDFYRDSHQVIYRAIRDLADLGQAIDAVTLAEELTRRDQIRAVGGLDVIGAILDATPHAANARYYAGIVREKSLARRLDDAAARARADVRAGQLPAGEMIGRLQADLVALHEAGSLRGLVPIRDAVARVRDLVARRVAGEIGGLTTGLSDLDHLLGGLRPGELVILAARPSMGKTALALNVCDYVAANGTPVLVVTLEMGEDQLVERAAVARARLDGHRVRLGYLGGDELDRMAGALDGLAPLAVSFDPAAAEGVLGVASAARGLALKGGIGLVVLDYIQLLEGHGDGDGGDRDSRQEQVAKISRRLKGLARELKVPVLALSQLNRAVEARPDRRPRMADLRESGAIEQDADVVMLLHRPEYYDPNDQPGVAELIVAKNRHGATGTVLLRFDKPSMRFDLLSQARDIGAY